MPGAETEQKTTEEVQKQEEEKTPVEQMKEKVAEEGNFSIFFDTFSKVEKLKPKMVTPRPTRKRKKKNQPLKGMA